MEKTMSVHAQDTATIIYAGPINRDGYQNITNVCETLSNPDLKKVNLILSTYGGDPDAAFRMARCLQHYFPDGITLFVPHYCKSAGTLIAIGAKELVIADRGELGPLDVQLIKADEMFERSSGLDITQGFDVLTYKALEMLKTVTIELKVSGGFSTRLASEIATNITVGAIAPIFAQIDPSRLGEIQRATEIASKYGLILEQKFNNVNADGVRSLIMDYPSHGFVIDRKEAKRIFKEVRAPDEEEVKLLNQIESFLQAVLDSPQTLCMEWNFETSSESQVPSETDKEEKYHDQSEFNSTSELSAQSLTRSADSKRSKRSSNPSE